MKNIIKIYNVLFNNSKERDLKKLNNKIKFQHFKIKKYWNGFLNKTKLCKATEEKYSCEYEKLNEELWDLQNEYKRICIEKLNTFPLNQPCTIESVLASVGIPIKNGKYFMITELSLDTSQIDDIIHYDINKSVVITQIQNISDTEVVFNIQFDTFKETIKYCMKLPNWRFVKSSHFAKFYVERFKE